MTKTLYTVTDDLFFGWLPDRTQGGNVNWGFLFNQKEIELACGTDALMEQPADIESYEKAQDYVNVHVKTLITQYDRLGEIFNLQMANDNRNRVANAIPRRTRTFLALGNSSPNIGDILILDEKVDRELNRCENLLTGELSMQPIPELYAVNTPRHVVPKVCYFASGLLVRLDRMRLLQEAIRREYETRQGSAD